MFVWSTEEVVKPISKIMGYQFNSPEMKQAVRHVMHRYASGGCQTLQQKPSEPLEASRAPQTKVSDAMAIGPGSTVQNFSMYHDGNYAVVDTGCQRSAVGINTLKRLMQCLPNELQVKFDRQQFRFSGIGGDTITKHVALIPVCFGATPGAIRAAVLEDGRSTSSVIIAHFAGLGDVHTSEGSHHDFSSHSRGRQVFPECQGSAVSSPF